jgi:hypothetical protein
VAIHLERKDLVNTQQMEIAVNGPDGATHLILCTGIADLGIVSHGTYTFLVGPTLSRRQFVGVIASGAISKIQRSETLRSEKKLDAGLNANLLSINAGYDEESKQVKVKTEVLSTILSTNLSISYHVSILAELQVY